MKCGMLILMVATLIIASAATAQEYSIRANRGLNLRAAPSLSADITGGVASGEVLQVLGASGEWLKISRHGSLVWLANWVNFTRVNGGAAAESQIDNCCFVDRQCQTDAEWTDGYWAFQRNECPAPAQSQTSTPATSDGQSNINNCCFLNWQCHDESQWIRGFRAYQTNSCDMPNASWGVAIEGSAAFVSSVNAALSLLRDAAPQWLAYATSALDAIKLVPDSQGSGLLGKTFHITQNHVNAGVYWLAGVIVHDACHVHERKAGSQYGTFEEQTREEIRCTQVQIQALREFDPQDRFTAYLQSLISDPNKYWWH